MGTQIGQQIIAESLQCMQLLPCTKRLCKGDLYRVSWLMATLREIKLRVTKINIPIASSKVPCKPVAYREHRAGGQIWSMALLSHLKRCLQCKSFSHHGNNEPASFFHILGLGTK